MTRFIQILFLLCLTGVLLDSSALAKDETEKEPWKGKLGNGTVITVDDLQLILNDHTKWITSEGREGKRANLVNCSLVNADLSEANLSNADLRKADLSNSNLFKANLKNANLLYANLSNTELSFADLNNSALILADLSNADLSYADLRNANLPLADLTNANLYNADLSNANFQFANLSNAKFEPKIGSMPKILPLFRCENLEKLTFTTSPHGLIQIRNKFRQYGFRDQERKITYALKHSSIQHVLDSDSVWKQAWGYTQIVLFEWTSDWGMSPGKPFSVLIGLIGLFALPYMFSLIGRNEDKRDGIWKVWAKDRLRQDLGNSELEPLTCSSGLQIWRYGLYFSLLSAVHIGWRDLNVGNWITRIQPREYTLRATGWVRTVSGVQSLISVYLLALALLTYFGRPFDQF